MDFNEQQLKAIHHKDGAVAVIAGAGSGKSTVLVNRIKNLVTEYRVSQKDILAISFTRNTADDLKKKLTSMWLSDVNVGTFHSICSRILFANGIDVSKKLPSWQIENCFKDINPKVDVEEVLSYIGYQKNHMKSFNDEFIYKESNYTEEELRLFFKLYEELKTKNSAYDFEDYLLHCYEVLKKSPCTFKYVLVDESQDSNLIQNLLLKELCKSGNIMAVGDYRQSLYQFRGATPEQFMNFENDWPNATIINMDTNYRSCNNIVYNANEFIKKYYGDYIHFSDAQSSIKADGSIKIITNESSVQESNIIVDEIQQLINSGEDPNNIAILYRLNAHSSNIECELKKRGIPYYISNDSSFFKRKEIAGLLSYLRLIENPSDDGAFENIFKLHNYPIKFLSDNILSEIRTYAGRNSLSYYESFISIKYDKSWQNQSMTTFNDGITRLLLQKEKGTPIETLIDNVIRIFKLQEFISNEYHNDEEIEDRKSSFDTLKRFIKGSTLKGFLEYTMVSKKKKESDGVKLMTIHGSKGLEFKNVFISGIEDDKFPHRKSDILEEARLFYVGITRAKENLYLSQIGQDNRFILEYLKPIDN